MLPIQIPRPESEGRPLNRGNFVNAVSFEDLQAQLLERSSEAQPNIFRPICLQLTESQADMMYRLQSEYKFSAQEAYAITTAYSETPEKLKQFLIEGDDGWQARLLPIGQIDQIDPATAEVRNTPEKFSFVFPPERDDNFRFEQLLANIEILANSTDNIQIAEIEREDLPRYAYMIDALKFSSGKKFFLRPIGRQDNTEEFIAEDAIRNHDALLWQMRDGTLEQSLLLFRRLLARHVINQLEYERGLTHAIDNLPIETSNVIIKIDNNDIIDGIHGVIHVGMNNDARVENYVGIQAIIRSLLAADGQGLLPVLRYLSQSSLKEVTMHIKDFVDEESLKFELIKYYIFNVIKAVNIEFQDSREDFASRCWERTGEILAIALKGRNFDPRHIEIYREFLPDDVSSDNSDAPNKTTKTHDKRNHKGSTKALRGAVAANEEPTKPSTGPGIRLVDRFSSLNGWTVINW